MFSNITKYGFRAVVYLGMTSSKEAKIDAKNVAKELDIPAPFLAKILQTLSKNDIICSTKGPGGGFYLSKENNDKKVITMINCLEGKKIFQSCVLGLPNCSNDAPCPMHHEIVKYRAGLSDFLTKSTIGELIENVEKGIIGSSL